MKEEGKQGGQGQGGGERGKTNKTYCIASDLWDFTVYLRVRKTLVS